MFKLTCGEYKINTYHEDTCGDYIVRKWIHSSIKIWYKVLLINSQYNNTDEITLQQNRLLNLI